jgi:predicted RNase H-like HicB family nuclease
MGSRQFQAFMEYDAEDKVWVTYVPALDNLSTFGETPDEAIENTREAVLGYLEAAAIEKIDVDAGTPPLQQFAIEVSV